MGYAEKISGTPVAPVGAGGLQKSWGLGVAEEEGRVGRVKPGSGAVGDTSIDKECVREGRLGEHGEQSGRGEVEPGVCSDRFFNTTMTKLSSDGEVVETSAKSVAVIDERNDGGKSIL
jgi:hypothetical protein